MEKRIEAKGNIIETLEGERFRILELVSESRMSDRSMGRPAIIVMVVNGSVSYFIAFFTRKFPR